MYVCLLFFSDLVVLVCLLQHGYSEGLNYLILLT